MKVTFPSHSSVGPGNDCTRLLAAGAILLLLATRTYAQEKSPKAGHAPTLTSVEQVRRLPRQQAALGYPVLLRGVVTYRDNEDLFVQDRTAGIWIDKGSHELPVDIQPGRLVEVEGQSAFSDYAPQIAMSSVRVLGSAPLPHPRQTSPSELMSGSEDSQWIEVEGTVRSAERRNGRLYLDLASGSGRITAYTPDFWPQDPIRWVDGRIRARGVCGTNFNEKGQLLSVDLRIPNRSEIFVLEAPPPDPFSSPIRPINTLMQFSPRGATRHRVRVRGLVTLRRGRSLYVRDETDSVFAQTLDASPIEVGTRVDVVGFPSAGEFAPVLQDAIFKKIGPALPPAPRPIMQAQGLQGTYDGELVQINGRVLDRDVYGSDLVLVLQAENHLFRALLDKGMLTEKPDAVPLQGVVQLTGICSVTTDEARRPIAFLLLLRSPRDIVVLERPPRFTLQYALRTLWVVGVVALGILAWVLVLRRKVAEQTEIIRERLRREAALRERYQELFENANDTVFTFGLRGHITSINRAGERLLLLAAPTLVGRDIAEILSPESAAAIRAIVDREDIDGRPRTLDLEFLASNERRISVEVSLRPVLSEGHTVGWQGIARDITERKRAERLRAAAYRISELANSAQRVDQVFRSTHEIVNELMPARNFYIALYDSAARILSFSYYVDERDTAPPPRTLRKGFTEYILRTAKPLHAPPEVLEELLKAGEVQLRGTPPHDRIGVPLKADGEPFGVLVVQTYDPEGRYGEEDKQALEFICDQIAMAIQRKRSEQERHLLHSLTQTLETAESLVSGLQTTIQDVCDVTGWAFGQLWFPKPDRTSLETISAWYSSAPGAGLFRKASEEMVFARGQGLPGRAWSTRQRVWAFDGHLEDDPHREAAASAAGFSSAMAVPILASDELVGVMEFFSFQTHAHDQGMLEILSSVAAQLGSVVLRKRAEEALRSSEERHRMMFANNPQPMWVYDLETLAFLEVNAAAVRHYGYSHAEFLAMTIKDIRPPEDVPKLLEAIQNLPPGLGFGQVWRHRKKDGTLIDVEILSHTLDFNGRRAELVLANDITERKRAEEALRRSEEHYRNLIELASDAIFLADAEFRLVDFNASACALSGYPREEIIGKSVLDFIPKEDLTSSPLKMEDLRTGKPVITERRFLRRDGTVVFVEVSNKMLPDGHFQGIVRNITERRRAAEELQRAKEAAEAANRSKSQFLANMSHEIRTPMNAIIGMSELALDTELPPEQREYIGTVKESAASLLAVINDILDFSKIEAGRFELERIEFDLWSHLGDTVKTLAFRAQKEGLELTYHYSPETVESVVGDPTRLRQVLINLIGNAIKFTKKGEVSVRVEELARTEDEITLHFRVTDTGIGIPLDKQQLIFEAFAQADASMTRQYGGTGLGLAISSQLVEMMGGRIWVESEPGKGSTFHFTARFGLPAAPGIKLVSIRDVILRDVPVLVVDDNATNRRILEETLKNWRMNPVLADGGDAALAALNEAKLVGRPFPLVLTDAQMPGMDGFTLAERIRQDPELGGAIIMMLTSAGQRGDARRCRELKIAAYLTKPIGQSELLEALVRTLGNGEEKAGRQRLVTRHSLRETRRALGILLAEDNAVNRALGTRLLEKRGHHVVTAGNGKEALALLEGAAPGAFDLVLMDLQMPEMDGLQATAAIREKEKETGRHIPIIAMTAHALKGDRERSLAAGMDGYLAKPIESNELFNTIQAVVPPATAAQGGTRTLSPSPAVLDEAALMARVDGDPQLVRELVSLFLQEYPRMMEEIRKAVETQDAKALERASHTLKGSVGNFGAKGVFDSALKLERIARAEELFAAESAFQILEAELARLRPALERLGTEATA